MQKEREERRERKEKNETRLKRKQSFVKNAGSGLREVKGNQQKQG